VIQIWTTGGPHPEALNVAASHYMTEPAFMTVPPVERRGSNRIQFRITVINQGDTMLRFAEYDQARPLIGRGWVLSSTPRITNPGRIGTRGVRDYANLSGHSHLASRRRRR